MEIFVIELFAIVRDDSVRDAESTDDGFSGESRYFLLDEVARGSTSAH